MDRTHTSEKDKNGAIKVIDSWMQTPNQPEFPAWLTVIAEGLALARQEGRQEGIEAALKIVKSIVHTGRNSKTPIVNALCSLRDGLIREEE